MAMTVPSKRLRVTRMSPRAQAWLKETRQAFVQYAFERVVDLVNQESDVLAISSHEVGAGPFSLVMEPGMFPNDVQADTQLLVFGENGLWLGDWLIDAEEAELWNPRPNWENLITDSDDCKWVTQILRVELTHHAELDSLARLILNPVANSPLPAKILRAAEQNIPLLFSSIQPLEPGLLRKAAKGLAGLGPGLTPAGDDLLLGAMHGIWATRPEAEAREISSLIARAAAPRTHVLSASWLEAAAEGEAAEPWHNLVAAIMAHDDAGLRNAIMRILPTGHTSGSDALGGFLGVLETPL
jgi:hypothetical protein